jgi:hypothetical protein
MPEMNNDGEVKPVPVRIGSLATTGTGTGALIAALLHGT